MIDRTMIAASAVAVAATWYSVRRVVAHRIRSIADGYAEDWNGEIDRSELAPADGARAPQSFISTGFSVALVMLAAIQMSYDDTLVGGLTRSLLSAAAAHANIAAASVAVVWVWITVFSVIHRRILEISNGYLEDWAGHGETAAELVPPQVKSRQGSTIDVDLEPVAASVEVRLRKVFATASAASDSEMDGNGTKDRSSTSVGGVWEFPF